MFTGKFQTYHDEGNIVIGEYNILWECYYSNDAEESDGLRYRVFKGSVLIAADELLDAFPEDLEDADSWKEFLTDEGLTEWE